MKIINKLALGLICTFMLTSLAISVEITHKKAKNGNPGLISKYILT